MSYLSDVKLVTTPEGWQSIVETVRQAMPDEWENIVSDTFTAIICGGKYVLYENYNVKWYEDDFPEVKAFMEGVRGLEEKDIPYKYMRVGEDYGDVDFYYSFRYGQAADMPNLSLKREIEVEY